MEWICLYFASSDDRVNVRFYDSRFFQQATHSDLLLQFSDATKDLKPNHMSEISMDGPSVNLKFYDCIEKKKREENELHNL